MGYYLNASHNGRRPQRYIRKRERLERTAAAMRARNLTHGKGCRSIARAIARRVK